MLSLSIDILHINRLDFKEEQIYGVDYERCAMLMNIKIIRSIYVEFKGLFFLNIREQFNNMDQLNISYNHEDIKEDREKGVSEKDIFYDKMLFLFVRFLTLS